MDKRSVRINHEESLKNINANDIGLFKNTFVLPQCKDTKFIKKLNKK